MNRTQPARSALDERWIDRYGWLLSAIWLLFLVMPALTILNSETLSSTTKWISIGIMVMFSAIYAHGFRAKQWRDQHGGCNPGRSGLRPERWPDGLGHTLSLAVIAVALYVIVGPAAIGVIPFVVSSAVFLGPWLLVGGFFAAGLVATTVMTIANGLLADLWFMPVIVVAVGGGTILIRMADTNQAERAHLNVGLAVSDERNRVARDVHDVLGHSLTAMILKVQLTQRLLDGLSPGDGSDRELVERSRAQLRELEEIGRGALAEIRSTVGGLRTADLADELAVARTVLADAGVGLTVTGDMNDVPDYQRPMLAWVVREAVTNIVRHAQASQCRVELDPGAGSVLLRVTDDGIGMNGRVEGNGLRGLRERVESLGGRVVVASAGASDTAAVDEASNSDRTGSDEHRSTAEPDSPGTRIEVLV